MNLDYAIDRLYDTGWDAAIDPDLESLPSGRRFPSVQSVQRQFASAGLQLQISHNQKFNCHRATWAPTGETVDPAHAADERHGTVIGACEREAAVYALAQHRSAHLQFAAV